MRIYLQTDLSSLLAYHPPMDLAMLLMYHFHASAASML